MPESSRFGPRHIWQSEEKRQSVEIDHEQAMDGERPPEDDQDTMPETSRFGHYRTRPAE